MFVWKNVICSRDAEAGFSIIIRDECRKEIEWVFIAASFYAVWFLSMSDENNCLDGAVLRIRNNVCWHDQQR